MRRGAAVVLVLVGIYFAGLGSVTVYDEHVRGALLICAGVGTIFTARALWFLVD